MNLKKEVSTSTGLIIIVVSAIVLFGIPLTFEYLMNV